MRTDRGPARQWSALREERGGRRVVPTLSLRQGSDFFFYIYERRDERNESGGDAPIALGRGAPARSFREYIFKFIEIEELV